MAFGTVVVPQTCLAWGAAEVARGRSQLGRREFLRCLLRT